MSSHEKLFLKPIPIGPMLNLAYFIGDISTREVGIVDPGWDIPDIISQAQKEHLKIVCVLLTHGHYDHVDGAKAIAQQLNIPVYISEKEIPMYRPDCAHLRTTVHRQKISIGQITIECLHTPGHSPGCQCFYYPGHLITGDTLFVGGCGRCDLPGGDEKALKKSIKDVIQKLPHETIIYPGHAYGLPTSSLKKEQKTNPYFLP